MPSVASVEVVVCLPSAALDEVPTEDYPFLDQVQDHAVEPEELLLAAKAELEVHTLELY